MSLCPALPGGNFREFPGFAAKTGHDSGVLSDKALAGRETAANLPPFPTVTCGEGTTIRRRK